MDLTTLQKRIEASLPEFEKAMADARLVGLQDTLGAMTYRIFNLGKDANGKDLGEYSERTKRIRQAKGLRIDRMDFQFTGRLFESMKVGTSGDVLTLGIDDAERAQVSEELEDRLGGPLGPRPVFQVSRSEEQNAVDVSLDFLFNRVGDILQSWSE